MARKSHPLILSALLLGKAGTGLAQTPVVGSTQLPTGGTVVGGQASIQSSAAAMTVNQASNRAVIDWNTFNIGAQAKVNFVQPSAAAVVLNRVLDSNPSQILGQLSATGQVFISNPNGVIFGTNARVDVGGLVATSQSMTASDFMAGKSTFAGGNANASVLNQGTLQATLGGYIALLAPQVRNEGVIVAREGTVVLAAGAQTTLDFSGTRLVSVIVDQPVIDALVENKQLIRAEGGYVVMSARSASTIMRTVINNTGSIQAPTLVEKGGRIVLEGGEQGVVRVGGNLNASATDSGGKGGSIAATGDKVQVTSDARLDASGPAGGGKINVGGGWQGQDASIRNANAVVVEAGARLDASATDNGNGGEVVVYSNTQLASGLTRASGELLARGGANGGDGGRIETSGHWISTAGVKADASASKGKAGQWLLDPWDVSIETTATTANASSAGTWAPTGPWSVVQNSDIDDMLNHGTNVTISTGSPGTDLGTITVNAPITQTTSTPVRLTLSANQGVFINKPITMRASGSILEVTTGNSTNTPTLNLTGNQVVLADAVNVDTLSMNLSGPNSSVTQTTQGVLTTNNLKVSGTQTDVTLTNSSNNVGVVAANVQSIAVTSNEGISQGSTYGKGLYVGTVAGVSGINATGAINLTSNSNIFVNQNIATTNAIVSTPSIVLSAGASLSEGSYNGADKAINPSGPNVILSNGVTILPGTGRAMIYMGSTSGSGAGLASYAGTGRFRYNSTQSVQNYADLGTATGLYVVLRQAPKLTVTATDATMVYGAAPPTTASVVSGFLNGDNASAAVTTAATVTISGDKSSAGYWSVGSQTLTPSNAYSPLGYGFTYVSGKLAVTAKPLTITGLAAYDKPYDQSTAATINASGMVATGLMLNDDVRLDLTKSTATFADKNASSTAKTVNLTNFYTGADLKNYSIVDQPTTTAKINPRDLTVWGTAVGKVYDGTTNVSSYQLYSDKLAGDDVALSATYASFVTKNVYRSGGAVAPAPVTIGGLSISGGDAGNYSLLNPSTQTSATVTPKSLTVTGLVATAKVYDSLNTFTLNDSGASFVGAVANDVLSVNKAAATATSATADAGSKTVTVSGLALSGTDSGNYAATFPSTLTSTITPKSVTVTGITASDKTYDGTNRTSIDMSGASLTAGDFLNGDTATLGTSGYGLIASGKNVTVTPSAVTVTGLTLSNTNYQAVDASGATANITARPLTVKALAADKMFDQNRRAGYQLTSDQVPGDQINLAALGASFDNANPGLNKTVTVSGVTLSGADASNYTWADGSAVQTKATIIAREMVASPVASTPSGSASSRGGALGPTSVSSASSAPVTSLASPLLLQPASAGGAASSATTVTTAVTTSSNAVPVVLTVLLGGGNAASATLGASAASGAPVASVTSSNTSTSVNVALMANVSNLSPNQVSALSPSQLQAVLSALDATQIKAISLSQAQALPAAAQAQLLARVAAVMGDATGFGAGAGASNTSSMNVALSVNRNVAAMTTSELAASLNDLSVQQLLALSRQQVDALTSAQRAQVASLTSMALQTRNLTSAQVAALSASDAASKMKYFSAAQLMALTSTQIQAMAADQQKTLGALLVQNIAVANLAAADIAAQAPTRLALLLPYLNATQLLAITPRQLAAMPDASRAEFNVFLQTMTDVSNLSPRQLSILSPTDLAAMAPYMTGAQLLTINIGQASALPAPQQQEIAALLAQVTRVRNLSANQIANLPADQLLPMLRLMSPQQLMSITDGQITRMGANGQQALITQLESAARSATSAM
ncbi:MAG: hypothetical protein RLZZ24_1057 [Pseudomonadota bacterium]